MLEIDPEQLHEWQMDIIRMGETHEGVRDILWTLARSDWEQLFLSDTQQCKFCLSDFPKRDLVRIRPRWDRNVCQPCFGSGGQRRCPRCKWIFVKPIEEHSNDCPDCKDDICGVCGQGTQPAYFPGIICPACREDKGVDSKWGHSEVAKLRSHEMRAKERGLVGYLPIRVWLSTLNDFHWQCAYCVHERYEQIDHFIPISCQGDSTIRNCVPSCRSCNKGKGRLMPAQVTSIPRSAMDRVQAYLQSRPVIPARLSY